MVKVKVTVGYDGDEITLNGKTYTDFITDGFGKQIINVSDIEIEHIDFINRRRVLTGYIKTFIESSKDTDDSIVFIFIAHELFKVYDACMQHFDVATTQEYFKLSKLVSDSMENSVKDI